MTTANNPAPYPHWMLREIYEQPATLAATLDHYIDGDGFRADTCASTLAWLPSIHSKLVIAASGSSRHAGLFAELVIEDLSGIAVDVEYASEYCYRSEKSMIDAAVLVVSQSGETADTLAALRKANLAGHATLAITNVDHSTMAREATASFPTVAGRERAIPATKSFTAQLLNLYLLALMNAAARGTIDRSELAVRLMEAAQLPRQIEAQLKGWDNAMREVADEYREAKNFLYLGRGLHYAIAREGALKLKESAYLHAEGYPSGELKHGPNALVAEGTPLVMIATVDRADDEFRTALRKNSAVDARHARAGRKRPRHREHRRRDRRRARQPHRLRRRAPRGSAGNLRGHSSTVALVLDGRQQRHRRRPPAQPDQGRPRRIVQPNGTESTAY